MKRTCDASSFDRNVHTVCKMYDISIENTVNRPVQLPKTCSGRVASVRQCELLVSVIARVLLYKSISTAPPVSSIANGRDVYTFLLPGFPGIEPVYPG
jgi:hypothetical protein